VTVCNPPDSRHLQIIINIDGSGTIVATTTCRKREAVKDLMKIEIPFLTGLFLIATTLLVRVTVQGIGPALFATAIEYSLNGIRGRRGLLSNINRLGR
jgi:hypothetical protein